MLLESLLAVCVLLAIGAAMSFADYKSIVWPTDPAIKSNPILGFSLAAGQLFQPRAGHPRCPGDGVRHPARRRIRHHDARRGGPAQPVSLRRALGHRCSRKCRGLLKRYWFNSGLVRRRCMWVLASSNAFNVLWPIFGTANQMLAALSLLAVSAWLLLRKKKTACHSHSRSCS